MRRIGVTLALCATAALLLSSVGVARPEAGSADLLVDGALALSTPKPVAGKPFSLFATVFNNGPDSSSFTLHITMPDGVTYSAEAHQECTTTSDPHDLICAGPNNPAPLGDDGSGMSGYFYASAAGSYQFVYRLSDLGAADPNLANNQKTVIVNVAAQPLPVAYRTAVTPTHPRAGTRFTVSFAVIDKATRQTQQPSNVHCRASLGGTRARSVAKRAICAVTTSPSMSGRRSTVVLSATAAGKRVSHAFQVRLR
jgi:hypothetical protein